MNGVVILFVALDVGNGDCDGRAGAEVLLAVLNEGIRELARGNERLDTENLNEDAATDDRDDSRLCLVAFANEGLTIFLRAIPETNALTAKSFDAVTADEECRFQSAVFRQIGDDEIDFSADTGFEVCLDGLIESLHRAVVRESLPHGFEVGVGELFNRDENLIRVIKNGHEVVEIVALLSPAVEYGANALDGSGEDALAEVRLIKVDHCLTAGNRFSIFDDTHAGCCVNGSLCAIVEATGAGIRANGEIGVHCHGLELVKGLRFLCGGDGVLNNETGVF